MLKFFRILTTKDFLNILKNQAVDWEKEMLIYTTHEELLKINKTKQNQRKETKNCGQPINRKGNLTRK